MLKLMAIDPGPHSGIAVHIEEGYRTIMYDGLSVLEDVLTSIWVHRPDLICIERFATAGRISQPGLFTVNMVGEVDGFVRAMRRAKVSNTKVLIMTPSSRRAFKFEAEQMGITKGPHELDALMHLLSIEHRIKQGHIKVEVSK